MNPLPVRAEKIEPPYLRPDTLSRKRLNGWLDRAAKGRLALVIADAGFGKTTLLGDWSNLSRRHVAWYRLEHDDRDWLTLVRHLVGGGRKLDAEFAPETYRMLCSLGPGGPTRDEIIESLARESAAFGAANSPGFSLILDDYHAIEGSNETDPVIASLLKATGDGFSMILSARKAPELPPLGGDRLRGHRLEGDELRFTVPETEALFRDAYTIPLEHDVTVDLVARTEGWAALLSLVRTRLEEQPNPDPRALVAQLSATQGDLYDFLTDEVLEQAPPELADFVVQVSILQDVTIPAAAMLSQLDPAEATRIIRESESIGLLQRVPGAERWHFAPLVREFLYAHLEQTRGRRKVREMHAAVARHFVGDDWQAAAHHLVLGGQPSEAVRQIAESIDEVLGRGEYRLALDLLCDAPQDDVVTAMLRARTLLQLGATEEALDAAKSAVRVAEERDPTKLSAALRNAAAIAMAVHDSATSLEFGQRAVGAARNQSERRLAEVQLGLPTLGGRANLPGFALRLEQLLKSHQRSRQAHYEAISALNLSLVYVWLGRFEQTLQLCSRAEQLLLKSSRGYEQVTATLTRARAYAFTGHWRDAEALIDGALTVEHPEGRTEAILESAWQAAWFGPTSRAREYLRQVQPRRLPPEWHALWLADMLWMSSEPAEMSSLLEQMSSEPTASFEVGATFRWHLSRTRGFARLGKMVEATASLAATQAVASAQASPVQQRLTDIQGALLDGPEAASSTIRASLTEEDGLLGVFATEIVGMIGALSSEAVAVVVRAAQLNPDRWRTPLRAVVERGAGATAAHAAAILEEIGEQADVCRLREYARRAKKTSDRLGEALTRRLAPRVWIEDLGMASIAIGGRRIDGRSIRRRSLGLLLFLTGQPNGAATPDQLIEALWPEIDPEAALNSVHQTIYVLRRVFDPAYKAGLSPEYLHFDTDLVWLDRELVDCRSWQCSRLLSRRDWTLQRLHELVEAYRGRYAADFPYEEWSSSYRDRLHAQFLAAIEQAVSGRLGLGDPEWRLWLGQQALQVDPEADALEAQVIGLYAAVNATAAAREQYSHYATALRTQLGIEPPAIEELRVEPDA